MAEQNAIARHQIEVEQRKTILKAIRGPNAARTMMALRFLGKLGQNGHLPGIPKNADAAITLAQTTVTPEGHYFSRAEFHLTTRTAPPQTFAYVLVSAYSNSDFQLEQAWHADAAGKVIDTYPVTPPPVRADPRVAFLGPANPGAEIDFQHWFHGSRGGAKAAIARSDAATGFQTFRIANTAAGPTNQADIRSESFPLGRAGSPPGPFTFSFAYKLPDGVAAGDNLEVALRFFGPGENNFLDQCVFRVGSSTDDSEMTQYKTVTATNLFAPAGAVSADVWLVANIFQPWTSGAGQFDSFSVTTARPRSWREIVTSLGIAAGVVLGLMAAGVLGWRYRRKPAPPI